MLLVFAIFHLAEIFQNVISKESKPNYGDRERTDRPETFHSAKDNISSCHPKSSYGTKSSISYLNDKKGLYKYIKDTVFKDAASHYPISSFDTSDRLKIYMGATMEDMKNNGIEFDMRKREDAYKQTDPRENPYAVGLIRTFQNNDPKDFCSGSLLTDEWVLTAAHCVAGASQDKLYVYAGGNSLWEASKRIKYKIPLKNDSQLRLSEEFFVNDQGLDIALIKLSEKVNLSDTVNTIKLSTKPWKHHSYRKCVTTGFGSVLTSKKHEDDQIRKTQELEVKQPCLCSYLLNFVTGGPSVDFLCAKPVQDYGVCHGDSGGGLVCDGQVVAVNMLIIPFGDVTYCEIDWAKIIFSLPFGGIRFSCGGKNILSVFQGICRSLPWINYHVKLYTDEELSECFNLSVQVLNIGTLSRFHHWLSLATIFMFLLVCEMFY